jgi:hypothetical protein
MKKLVFAALVLGGLMQATGCVISSDDDDTGVFHAQWTLIGRYAADPETPSDTVLTCDDAGVASIAVHSLPSSGLDCDPNFAGNECVDVFDCIDGNGHTAPLFADTYTVWMEALDINDDPIAISFSSPETALGGGDDIEMDMSWPVDAGNFSLTWTLIDAASNPQTCADVGSGGVEVTTTPVLNQATFVDNTFNCEDGEGMAVDNHLGENTVVVSILEEGTDASLGDSVPRNETLALGNDVIDLGNFEFCFGAGC